MPGMRLYTPAEMDEFVPPPCPADGSDVIPKWLDMEAMGTGSQFGVLPLRCTNDGCEMSDPEPRADWGPEWDAAMHQD